jgi:hypothetical protein
MKKNLFLLVLTLLLCSFISNAQSSSNNRDKRSRFSFDDTKKSEKDNSKLNTTTEIVDFSGEGTYEVFPSDKGWQFFGPTRRINVRDEQKIVGVGSAVFGTTSGTSRIAVSLCYLKENGAIVALNGDNHLIADADSQRRTFSVSVAAELPAGTYSVGYCVVNQGKQTLGNNDYVNGWIMTVN